MKIIAEKKKEYEVYDLPGMDEKTALEYVKAAIRKLIKERSKRKRLVGWTFKAEKDD